MKPHTAISAEPITLGRFPAAPVSHPAPAMPQPRLDELLRLFLAELVGGEQADPASLRRGLATLDPASLDRLLFEADANRVLPALGSVLDRGPDSDLVPERLRVPATNAWRVNRLRNRAIVAIANRVQQALEAAGERPILFKGIHYLDWLWPDVGSRRLQDLDLVMPGADLARCRDALAPIGFKPIEEPASDAIHLRHPMGLELDLHHRFRIFEHLGDAADVVSYRSRISAGASWRVFEPNRELASLIHHHCSNHVEAEGARLCWIADLALRLRESRHEDVDQVCALVGETRRLERAAWLIALIEDALGIPLTRWRRALPTPRDRVDWATAMASNRLLPFGLPRARGWAKFVVSCVGLRRDRWGPRPTLADLRRLPSVMRSLGSASSRRSD